MRGDRDGVDVEIALRRNDSYTETVACLREASHASPTDLAFDTQPEPMRLVSA